MPNINPSAWLQYGALGLLGMVLLLGFWSAWWVGARVSYFYMMLLNKLDKNTEATLELRDEQRRRNGNGGAQQQ